MTLTPICADNLSQLSHIQHGFFNRQGGVSKGIYEGLNCGPGSDDDQGNISENRQRVARYLNVEPPNLISLYQHHGAEVIEIGVENVGILRPKADAMISQTLGIALGILTADCVPVLFADRERPIIAAAHAGWKGAIGGVLPNTIANMETKGSKRRDIVAAIGPAIAQPSYEVDAGYRDRILIEAPENEVYFLAGDRAGHFQFDLPGYVHDQLAGLGLGSVENLGIDTYVNSERFFSYRRTTHRSEADYGRQISAIVLT